MQRTHETTLDMGDLGDQPVTVYYDWQPYEAGSYWQPEVPEDFDITDIKWGKLSILSLVSDAAIEAIETEMKERKNDDD